MSPLCVVLGVFHCGYCGVVGVCGMSPLCVVLGVFHCGYHGVVGFVVCPHSVLSLGCSTVDIVVL